MTLTANGSVRDPDGNGSLTLQTTIGSEALVGESMCEGAQVTIGLGWFWFAGD